MTYRLKSLRSSKPFPASERFALSYLPEPNSGCWLWLGRPRGSNDYGSIQVNGRAVQAHRFSWELHKGAAIPDGLFVLHRCDNSACVNPDHLFLGTNLDNSNDKVAKQRQARGRGLAAAQRENRARGGRNGNSKLSAEQVAMILKSNKPQRAIAAEHGISQSTVSLIKLGKVWK